MGVKAIGAATPLTPRFVPEYHSPHRQWVNTVFSSGKRSALHRIFRCAQTPFGRVAT
jgi:hypothetical protein